LLRARTDGDEPMPREVVAEIVQELRLVDLDSHRARTVPAWAVVIPSAPPGVIGQCSTDDLGEFPGPRRLPATRIQLLDVFAGLTRFTDDPMGVFLEGFVLSPLGSTERAESGCLSRRGSVDACACYWPCDCRDRVRGYRRACPFPALAVPSLRPVLFWPAPTARDEPPRPGDAVMFLPRLFRPFGPLGIAFMAYRYWRRLSPQRKAEINERVRGLTRLGSPSGDLPR